MSIVGHTAYDAARGPVGGASDSCEGSVARRRDCNCEVAAEMWCARGGGVREERRAPLWCLGEGRPNGNFSFMFYFCLSMRLFFLFAWTALACVRPRASCSALDLFREMNPPLTG